MLAVILGIVAWRGYLVSRVFFVSTGSLAGAEIFEPVDKFRLESGDKTVLLFFTLTSNSGIPLISELEVVNLGEWRLSLPVNTYVELNDGMVVEVSKLYYAGERLSNQTTGLGFLTDVVEQTAGVKIDGYFSMDTTGCRSDESLCSLTELANGLDWTDLVVAPGKAESALQKVSASCEAREVPQLLQLTYSDLIESQDVPVNRLEQSTLQGQPVIFLRSSVVSDTIRRFPVSRPIMIEQARVEVYNGTDVAGLAGQNAVKFRNSGLNVTRTEDAPLTLETTTVYVNDYDDFSASVGVVQHDLGGKAVIKREKPPFSSAGDVVVVMGYNSVE